jgi:hypothetical protein
MLFSMDCNMEGALRVSFWEKIQLLFVKSQAISDISGYGFAYKLWNGKLYIIKEVSPL